MVPWGDSPREGRAAHGPLHPAVLIPLGCCCGFLLGFCFRLFRSLSVRCEAIVISQGSVLLSGPLSPSQPDPCLFFNCLSPSFLSLSGAFVDAVSLSLSLSLSFFLSQALGKPKPRVGFGFPLVFSASRPRTSSSTRTSWSSTSPRLRPAPVFFFFFAARSPSWWFSRVLSFRCGGHGGCLLWSVMVLCPRFLSLGLVALSSFLWVGGVPLVAFPRWFPRGSWVGEGAFSPTVSCILHLLLHLGQPGLRTRNPPGPCSSLP